MITNQRQQEKFQNQRKRPASRSYSSGSADELDSCLQRCLARARARNTAGAECAAMEAVTRALSTYNPRKCSSVHRWCQLKVRFALRNLKAEIPTALIRDAYIEFTRLKKYRPSFFELCSFGEFSPRQVVAAWSQVVQDLQLSASGDSVSGEIADLLGVPAQSREPQTESDFSKVWECLSQIPDAWLLVARLSCGFTEREILDFLRKARTAHAANPTPAALNQMCADFLRNGGEATDCAFPDDLLTVKNRSTLAVRLMRAKQDFISHFTTPAHQPH